MFLLLLKIGDSAALACGEDCLRFLCSGVSKMAIVLSYVMARSVFAFRVPTSLKNSAIVLSYLMARG